MNEEIIINNNNNNSPLWWTTNRTAWAAIYSVTIYIYYCIYSVIYLAYKHTKAHAETHVSNQSVNNHKPRIQYLPVCKYIVVVTDAVSTVWIVNYLCSWKGRFVVFCRFVMDTSKSHSHIIMPLLNYISISIDIVLLFCSIIGISSKQFLFAVHYCCHTVVLWSSVRQDIRMLFMKLRELTVYL